MADPADLLRQVHRLHVRIEDLQNAVRRLPIQLNAYNAKVAKHEALLAEAQDALKQSQVKNRERESALKTAHAQMEKYQKQIKSASSKKEYDALLAELAAERRRIPAMEDEILVVMEEIEQKAAKLPAVEASLKAAQKERDEFQQMTPGRNEELEEQLQEAGRQLIDAESALSGDVREHYDRIVKAQGGSDAMSAVDGQVCRACATEITPQTEQDLMLRKFVKCKACGRILYQAQ